MTDPVRGLLDWLDAPSVAHGLRFADHRGGWSVVPYSALALSARRIGAALVDRGIGRGDVVTLVQRSGPAFVSSLFGALSVGAIPSPIAPPLAFQDVRDYDVHIRGVLRASQPKLIVTERDLVVEVASHLPTMRTGDVLSTDALVNGAESDEAGIVEGEVALIQFTSGSSGSPRGVVVPTASLRQNVHAIRRWLAMTPDDATATWLPIHHDMGLIGCLLTPVVNQSDVWIFQPEQFIRSPIRYLRCFSGDGATLTAMPTFGLEYITRRVKSAQLEGLDLSRWRTLIVGAERVADRSLEQFHALLSPHGFRRRAFAPAYGLAEATLAVTGVPVHEEPAMVAASRGSIAFGRPVVLNAPTDDAERLVGCGTPVVGVAVRIADDDGNDLADGHVGEVVIRGKSISGGYTGDADGVSHTRFVDGELRSGDAGFIVNGQLFVLGRLGDSMKVRGRAVFAEDIEAALAAGGVPHDRMAIILGVNDSVPTVVAVVENALPGWVERAAAILRRTGTDAACLIIDAPRRTIQRTTSGKPKRRALWQAFVGGALPGVPIEVVATDASD